MQVNYHNQPINIYLSENIKFILKYHNLSYTEFILQTDIKCNTATLVKWINEIEYPSIENIIKISLTFKLSLDELITENLSLKESLTK